MAYRITQCGSWSRDGVLKTITGFTAPATLTYSGSGVVTAGSIAKIEGSTSNDGEYSVVTNPVGTITVDPPIIVTEPPLGVVRTCLNYGTKINTVAVTAYNSATQIRCDGTDFVAAKVHKNDRVIISGSTNNDRSYYVDTVDATNLVSVRPLNSAASLPLNTAVHDGSLKVVNGSHEIEFLNEATPTLALFWAGAVVDPVFGSGVMADFVDTYPAVDEEYTVWVFLGIARIRMHNSGATASTFDSLREVLINKSIVSGNPSNKYIELLATGALSSEGIFRFGSASGQTDDTSAVFGCALLGLQSQHPASYQENDMQKARIESYGSVFFQGSRVGFLHKNSKIHSSLVAGVFGLPQLFDTGGAPEMHAVIQYAASIPYSLASGLQSSNFVNSYSSTYSLIGYSIGEVWFEGFKKSDASYATPFAPWGATTMNILNPQEPYALSELIVTGNDGREGKVWYDWQPVFRERDVNGVEGNPLEGLTVRVWNRPVDYVLFVDAVLPGLFQADYWDVEIAGSPFTTDANGKIDPTGITLLREWWARWVETYPFNWDHTFYVQRITVEGNGYRYVDTLQKIDSKLVPVDFFVDALATDFEGEVST